MQEKFCSAAIHDCVSIEIVKNHSVNVSLRFLRRGAGPNRFASDVWQEALRLAARAVRRDGMARVVFAFVEGWPRG